MLAEHGASWRDRTPDEALARIGRPFAITEMAFKNHGCCGHLFAALDAVGALQRESGFGPDDVEAVPGGGDCATREVCDRPHAMTGQDCRFATQSAVATVMRFGAVPLLAFASDRLDDPRAPALMARVSVQIDPECAAVFPAQRSAKVELL